MDVDGYLKRKRQRLHDIALDAIDEVRETGEPVDLKPMNSFERKIVHDVVREEGMKSRFPRRGTASLRHGVSQGFRCRRY